MPITCRLYKEGVLKEEAFDPARVSDLLEEEGARVWLDVEDPTDDKLVDSEIHAFAGHRYLLTLRYAPAFDLSGVLKRWDRRPEHTSQGGGFFFYALMDEIVDGYFSVVERFEDLSEDIEDRVFAE